MTEHTMIQVLTWLGWAAAAGMLLATAIWGLYVALRLVVDIDVLVSVAIEAREQGCPVKLQLKWPR